MDQTTKKSTTIRFLSFANDEENAEKAAKLKEAAQKIEQAIAREKSISELVDYVPPDPEEANIDLQNDTRPLYERLLEQRNKKQETIEESQKLSNFVTKLDEDDASFLNDLARKKYEDEERKRLEVYDILEGKKRLDERGNLEGEERKSKGSFVKSRSTASTSSLLALKSKFKSTMKVKPKAKAQDEESKSPVIDRTSPPENQSLDSVNNESANRMSTTRQPNSNSEQKPKTGYKISDDSHDKDCKRQKKDEERDKSDDQKKNDTSNEGPNCYCTSKNVMQCIGILPALPQAPKRDSSDSDNSDDDLNRRIVPRVGRRK